MKLFYTYEKIAYSILFVGACFITSIAINNNNISYAQPNLSHDTPIIDSASTNVNESEQFILQAKSCEEVYQIPSQTSGDNSSSNAVKLSIGSKLDFNVGVYWQSFKKDEILYLSIPAQNSYPGNGLLTYPMHSWIIRDENGDCIAGYYITSEQAEKSKSWTIMLEPSQEVIFVNTEFENYIRNRIGKNTGTIFQEDLLEIKEIELDGVEFKNLQDIRYFLNLKKLKLADAGLYALDGIENLTNLEWLDLRFNDVANLEGLRQLKKLSLIRLWENSVSDLTPLYDLNKLRQLYIDGNKIKSFEMIKPLLPQLRGLGMCNLKELDPNSLDFSTFSTNALYLQICDLNLNNEHIKNIFSGCIEPCFPYLRQLNLRGNDISNIEPLLNISGLKLPTDALELNNNLIPSPDDDPRYQEDQNPLKILARRGIKISYENQKTGTISALDIEKEATNKPANAVLFTDYYLDKLVRNEIGKPEIDTRDFKMGYLQPHQYLTTKDVAEIKRLDGESLYIKDLTGIEHLTNLTNLRLPRNNIDNLKPLTGLENLTTLNFEDNNIKDLSPLSGLKNLTTLNIANNNIEHLDDLMELNNLKILIATDNDIDTLGLPPNTLKNLEILSIGGNNFKNPDELYESLGLLESIQVLGLEDISIIDNIGWMNNDVFNIKKGEQGLYRLNIVGTSITAVPELSNFKNFVDGINTKEMILWSDFNAPTTNDLPIYDCSNAPYGSQVASTCWADSAWQCLYPDGQYAYDRIQSLPSSEEVNGARFYVDGGKEAYELYLQLCDLPRIEQGVKINIIYTEPLFIYNSECLTKNALSDISLLRIESDDHPDPDNCGRNNKVSSINQPFNNSSTEQPSGNSSNFISDVQLEQAIMQELGFSYEMLSDPDALAGIIIINLSGRGINNIDLISRMTNLQELDISNNLIQDIGALKELNALEVINLNSNPIDDLSALKDLPNLRWLNMSQLATTSISDMSFRGSPIETLIVTDSGMSDDSFNDFDIFYNLKELNVSGNNITRLDVLGGLSSFANGGTIILNNNNINDLGPLYANPSMCCELYLEVINNPLNEYSYETISNELRNRGVDVVLGEPQYIKKSTNVLGTNIEYTGNVLGTDIGYTGGGEGDSFYYEEKENSRGFLFNVDNTPEWATVLGLTDFNTLLDPTVIAMLGIFITLMGTISGMVRGR